MPRLKKSRRVKFNESEFIQEKAKDYAILIFNGTELDIKDYTVEDENKVESYYEGQVYAIEEGIYDISFFFKYPYSPPYGNIRSGRYGQTKRLHLQLNLIKGEVYRLRLLHWTLIDKKQPFEELYSETIICTPENGIEAEVTFVLEKITQK